MCSKSGNLIDSELDYCPIHSDSGELKREYDFGMMDCTVCTYTCGCATVSDDSTSLEGKAYWYRSYSEAAGHARLIVARKSASPLR